MRHTGKSNNDKTNTKTVTIGRNGEIVRNAGNAESIDIIGPEVGTDPSILKYYGGLSLHQQSHGQAFISFFENRCKIKGLYLLDEPEAALSPLNQLTLLKTLVKITHKGKGQFIISTHSPVILSFPGAQILSFDHIPIRKISYEETHSYQFYKSFINDRGSY